MDWTHTRALLGDDFLDHEPEDDEQRQAFDAELAASTAEGRPFSALRLLSRLSGSGITEVRPGLYLAREAGGDSDAGGWISGAC